MKAAIERNSRAMKIINSLFAGTSRSILAAGCLSALGWLLVETASAATIAYWRFEESHGWNGVEVYPISPADGTNMDTSGGGWYVSAFDEVTGDLTLSSNGTAGNYLQSGSAPQWSVSVPAAQVPNPDPVDTSDANGTINAGGVNTRSLFFQQWKIAESRSNVFSPTAAFTIEAYVRRDNSVFGGRGLATIAHQSVVNADDANAGWGFFLQGGGDEGGGRGPAFDGSLVLRLCNTTDTAARDFYLTDNLITDSNWHHVAATRDALGNVALYVDGVAGTLGGFGSSYAGSLDSPSSWFAVGGTLNQYRNFGGWIDEVRLSDAALTKQGFLNAIPEPSTVMLLAFGGGLLLRRRRR